MPAIAGCLELDGMSDDWSTYAEATSAGVVDEVWRRKRGRPPTEDEVTRLQDRLDRDMRGSFLDGPDRVMPVRGAAAFIEQLRQSSDWRIAIATGNWGREAAVKLQSAGLTLSDLPMATSDDRMTRRDIVKLAVERASLAYGISDWAAIVYVGDRPWDLMAATANGLRFLGIGTGTRADRLRQAGARVVIGDYGDAGMALRSLLTAALG